MGGQTSSALHRPRPIPIGVTPEQISSVQAKLEWAGGVLLAMRLGGLGPSGYKNNWPAYARDAVVAYGYSKERLRPACPPSEDISKMDSILAWIEYIPGDKAVIKRIVSARCLVSPVNLRYLYSWGKIAKLLGVDRRQVVRWHRQGLVIIAEELLRRRPL